MKRKKSLRLMGLFTGILLFTVAFVFLKTDFLGEDPTKTIELFIVQDTAVGVPNWTATGSGAKSYDVFVAEYDATNTAQVQFRSAYVKVSGIAKASAAFSVRVKVNAQVAETYNFPSTGGNPLFFNVSFKVTSLNYDYPADTTATNTLEIDFPTAPTSVSLLGAKQIFTYSINTAV